MNIDRSSPTNRRRLRAPSALRRRTQRGLSLFIALIAIVALSLAGAALLRSVDTGNQVAGNLAFRQAAVHAADLGVEAAFAGIGALALDTVSKPTGAGTFWYYPTRRAEDNDGVPTDTAADSALPAVPINWSTVPNTVTNNGYAVQVVVDRLCTGTPPIADPVVQCVADPDNLGGSRVINATVFGGASAIYYRVTARVTGPRGTSVTVQSALSRGA